MFKIHLLKSPTFCRRKQTSYMHNSPTADNTNVRHQGSGRQADCKKGELTHTHADDPQRPCAEGKSQDRDEGHTHAPYASLCSDHGPEQATPGHAEGHGCKGAHGAHRVLDLV